MAMEERIQIRELDVYAVAEKGDEVLKRGSTDLFDRRVLLTGIRAVLGLR